MKSNVTVSAPAFKYLCISVVPQTGTVGVLSSEEKETRLEGWVARGSASGAGGARVWMGGTRLWSWGPAGWDGWHRAAGLHVCKRLSRRFDRSGQVPLPVKRVLVPVQRVPGRFGAGCWEVRGPGSGRRFGSTRIREPSKRSQAPHGLLHRFGFRSRIQHVRCDFRCRDGIELWIW